MKKLLILTILVLVSTFIFAQAKPDTAKKAPVYAPDLTTQHEVTVKGVTLSQINNYLIFEQYGQQLDSSDKLSGAQITAIKKDALIVIQEISKQFGDLLAEDKKKWDKEHKTLTK